MRDKKMENKKCRTGKCEIEKCSTKTQDWQMREKQITCVIID